MFAGDLTYEVGEKKRDADLERSRFEELSSEIESNLLTIVRYLVLTLEIFQKSINSNHHILYRIYCDRV